MVTEPQIFRKISIQDSVWFLDQREMHPSQNNHRLFHIITTLRKVIKITWQESNSSGNSSILLLFNMELKIN